MTRIVLKDSVARYSRVGEGTCRALDAMPEVSWKRETRDSCALQAAAGGFGTYPGPHPRGQRILAALGNGAMVRYDYDDVTFRLKRLRSEGYTKPDGTTYSPAGPVHQDFSYTYDAAGNITALDSDSANVGVGGTDHLQRVFEYDPIYRLKKASGREYAGSKTEPWDDNAGNSNDPNQTRAYTELFEYDDVGNMTKLTHDYQGASPGTWTRNFSHETGSNQLDTMNDGGGTTRSYEYDAAGNLTTENTNRKHEWDWGGRMRSFRNQTAGSQATKFAHYTYDSGGQRTQKVVTKQNGDPVHTVYIGGIYEHHEKISSGSVTAENNFLHIMDDARRVAIKRIGAHLDGSNPANIQYHLGDHLQSSSVVLDGSGNFFNREEYRPYGETSFGSYKKKRYRFTGQERDEESGLNYHGARYYAPWCAQWTAPDPRGMVDGLGLFTYSQSNPVNLLDPSGTQSKPPRPLTPTDFQNVSQDPSRVPYLHFSYTPITGPQQPPTSRLLPKSRQIISTLESFQESGASQKPESVERSGLVHINEKDGSVTVYQLTENETATLRSKNPSKSSNQDPSSPDPSDRLMAIRQRRKKPSGSLTQGTLIPWHTHPRQRATGRIFSGDDCYQARNLMEM